MVFARAAQAEGGKDHEEIDFAKQMCLKSCVKAMQISLFNMSMSM